MNEFVCILGREPELSVAELEAVFGVAQVMVLSPEAALVRSNSLEPSTLKRLGGCQKLVRLVERVAAGAQAEAAVMEWLRPEKLVELLPADGRDVGLSLYGGSQAGQERLRKHLLGLKKELRLNGRAMRVVTSKERHLSAVTVQRQGLLSHGVEVVAVVQPKEVFIGVTIAVQDYQAYSLRDYGRPSADPKRGMIPPKLAQMLLNIAGLKSDDVLLDPFCGVGTILQEAILLGAKMIHGSDSDAAAVRAAQENVRWLLKEYPGQTADVEIVRRDARQNSVRPTVIVTEPDLGKPMSPRTTPEFMEREARRLEQLYLTVFQQWATTVDPGTRIVMVWPMFVAGQHLIALDLEKVITGLGFELEPPLSPTSAERLNVTNPRLLEYGRDDARVRRQIRKWVKI